MVETNDEERQKKYEDKISLRSLLLRDIDRINKALLTHSRTGKDELENLLSDLPEDIYRSVIPEMNKRTKEYNKQLSILEEKYDEEMGNTGHHPFDRPKRRRIKSWYKSEIQKLSRGYVREVKKLIRWTMDEFGLGLEEEGKRIDEGGIK